MGFEEASKKYARLILLIFASIITGGVFFVPGFIEGESAARVVGVRNEWMIIYTMIVVFYFKEKEIT